MNGHTEWKTGNHAIRTAEKMRITVVSKIYFWWLKPVQAHRQKLQIVSAL